MGYTHIGHCFKSNLPEKEREVHEEDETAGEAKDQTWEKVAIGDDLGTLNYMMAQLRLEFLRIPFMKDFSVRAFTYAELAFYPTLKALRVPLPQLFKEHTRLSAGFGLAIPINEMISILVYYNSLNLNSSAGDHERRGYLNINIGFF